MKRFFPLPVNMGMITVVAVILTGLLAGTMMWFRYRQATPIYWAGALRCQADSRFQIFYDIGNGFNENDSVVATITSSSKFQWIYLPLPATLVHRIRIDPSDHPGVIEIRDMHWTDDWHVRLTSIDPKQLLPAHQIDAIHSENNSLRIQTSKDARDPYLYLQMDNRIKNHAPFFQKEFLIRTIFAGGTIWWLLWFIVRLSGSNVFQMAPLSGTSATITAVFWFGAAACFWTWDIQYRNFCSRPHFPDRKIDSVPYPKIISSDSVSIMRQDGIQLAASLHRPVMNAPISPLIRAIVVLLHGNTPEGRRLPLYQILAEELRNRNFLVLSVDFAGFGQSRDPFENGPVDTVDMTGDVFVALDYLENMRVVTHAPVFLIGHSMGAGPALEAGIEDHRVTGMIAIGPPRRVTARYSDPPDRDFFWKRAGDIRHRLYGKPFPEWFSKSDWLKGIMDADMKKHIPYFSRSNHKPLLLMDGEREGWPDKIYLKTYYKMMSGPKAYVTVHNSDHFANTGYQNGLPVYDPSVMSETIRVLEQWMTDPDQRFFALRHSLKCLRP